MEKLPLPDNTMPAQATCLATGQVEAMPYGLAYFNKMISPTSATCPHKAFLFVFCIGIDQT